MKRRGTGSHVSPLPQLWLRARLVILSDPAWVQPQIKLLCEAEKRKDAALDKDKQRQPTQVSSHWQLFCSCVCVLSKVIQNDENAVCLFCAFWCLSIFCRTSPPVLNHSSRSASCVAQAAVGGWGGQQGEASWRTHIPQVRNRHSCSPVRPRPMSSSPGSAN